MTGQLYPENQKPALDADIFRNPPAVYRGTPFWAWNDRLDAGELVRQLGVFKEMGLGGGHMHSRTGLDTPYLGDEFMACVKTCVEHCRANGMLAWLYDEDRWPSGAAGGLVTHDPAYRSRHLLLTANPYGRSAPTHVNVSAAWGARAENGYLIARYEVQLEKGILTSYRRLAEGEPVAPNAREWFAYLETAEPSTWFNNETYVDTLSPAAIQRFIDVTHERYAEVVGNEFGKTVPAIFTDEPQFARKQTLRHAEDVTDVVLPFTDDLPDTFTEAYGSDLLDTLPEVIWELPGRAVSVTRYQYHDHVAERFASAFADRIGNWCAAHNLLLTGHLMEEPTLESQTQALGDAMRSYRSFQLPGIDILCDRREYTTAKQAQSAAHQYGCPGVLSELYGVTDWDFDFAGHKSQGDWQAALGVTVRVHHLSWVSMAGEAKRDYPASISYQSPWWREYRTVENHFARVNSVLTRGRPCVRLGVIHPIESYWLCYGPYDQTAVERDEREYSFQALTEWLLHGMVDFDFVAESLLPGQMPDQPGDRFQVGEMGYETILVPAMRTIRRSTLERLEAFAARGGRLIFAGEIPSLVDAEPSDRAAVLAGSCESVPFARARILEALEPLRVISVRNADGMPGKSYLYQLREEGTSRYLFICNTDRQGIRNGTEIRIRGEWQATFLDTASGEQCPAAVVHDAGQTVLRWDAPAHGHLLLKLEPGRATGGISLCRRPTVELGRLDGPVSVSLDEPNVLLLDQAEWRVNAGEWRDREELLRLDNLARVQLGLKPREGHIAQPWTEQEDPRTLGTLDLRFRISCACEVNVPRLAIEQPQGLTLRLDGRDIPVEDCGWWVDKALRTLCLPDLAAGDHELTVSIGYHSRTNVEWAYLLGDFGVRLAGRDAVLTPAVRRLAFGDWCSQGLPFYTGAVTYHAEMEATGADIAMRMPHFRGALAVVSIDGTRIGPVAFAPFELELGSIPAGKHALDITLYGTRYNAFGALHLTTPKPWVGPVWRSDGDDWAYEYTLRPAGILKAPRLMACS